MGVDATLPQPIDDAAGTEFFHRPNVAELSVSWPGAPCAAAEPDAPCPAPAVIANLHVMTQPARLAAVLFDMDGTLVDSEKVWQAALTDLAARYGATLSPEGERAVLGATTREAMEILFTDIGRPGEDQRAAGEWLEARVKALFAQEVAWQPGARELVSAVRAAGLKTALVTATGRPITEVMLDTMGRHNFDVTITNDDVSRGKPNPEPYRLAAAKLGVAIGDCVAVEDSPVGIASAVGAGCAVLAVPSEISLSTQDTRSGAATIVPSLIGVDLEFLRGLVAGGAPTPPATLRH